MISRPIQLLLAALTGLFIAQWAMWSIHERRDAQMEAALKTCFDHVDAGKPLPMKAKP